MSTQVQRRKKRVGPDCPLRVCPIEGCTAKVQKKLWNHFDKYHRETTVKEWHLLIKKAKIIPWKATPSPTIGRRLRGQATIEGLFAKQASRKDANTDGTLPASFEDVGHIEADYVPKCRGTRDYDMFNVDEEGQMLIFREWLESSEGGNRAEKPAREIAKDVSKYFEVLPPGACQQTLLGGNPRQDHCPALPQEAREGQGGQRGS